MAHPPSIRYRRAWSSDANSFVTAILIACIKNFT
jgi:hypothetical protein